jgi:hypothetical protein
VYVYELIDGEVKVDKIDFKKTTAATHSAHWICSLQVFFSFSFPGIVFGFLEMKCDPLFVHIWVEKAFGSFMSYDNLEPSMKFIVYE